jgi:hypothetical protein
MTSAADDPGAIDGERGHLVVDAAHLGPAPGVGLLGVGRRAEEAPHLAQVAGAPDAVLGLRAGEVRAFEPVAERAVRRARALRRRLDARPERRVVDVRAREARREPAEGRPLALVGAPLLHGRTHLARGDELPAVEPLGERAAIPFEHRRDALEARGDGRPPGDGGGVHGVEHHAHRLERRREVVEVDAVVAVVEGREVLVEPVEGDVRGEAGPAVGLRGERGEALAPCAERRGGAGDALGGEVVPAVVVAGDAHEGGLHGPQRGELVDERVGEGEGVGGHGCLLVLLAR